MSDDAARHYKLKTVKANLYVRKMTLNDDVVSAFEKNFLTSSASSPYLETLKNISGVNGSPQLETRRYFCHRTVL